MSDLRNCPNCGKLFAFQGKNLCRKCQEYEEDEYLIVRRYVRDHAGSSVMEVAEATGVEEEKILAFLREGRLLSRGFVGSLECERCGRKIAGGRYCDQCVYELDNQFKAVIPRKEPEKPITPSSPAGNRMHIKDGKSR